MVYKEEVISEFFESDLLDSYNDINNDFLF